MFPREEITDDWRRWEAGRLAWALEGHLISSEDLVHHSPPTWLSDMVEENDASEQPMPMGLGFHEKTGYFVVCSQGQGPAICGIEKIGPISESETVDDDLDEDDDEICPF